MGRGRERDGKRERVTEKKKITGRQAKTNKHTNKAWVEKWG